MIITINTHHCTKKELQELLVQKDKRHLNTGSDTEALLNVFAHELQQQSEQELSPDAIFKAVAGVHDRAAKNRHL